MLDAPRDGPERRVLHRGRSNFATKTAKDDARELGHRFSLAPPHEEGEPPNVDGSHKHRDEENRGLHEVHAHLPRHELLDTALTDQMQKYPNQGVHDHKYKARSGTHGSGDTAKLGTFSGVFVPTTLNVLSILMFLRFGFILGQGGLLGIMALLIASYLINLVTTLSVSAIATNGTVRGGGAYYLISRSLGPEFGGSIGIVFYLGSVFNTSMNAVGLIDCFKQNFGMHSGDWANWLPESFWYDYLWATIVLLLCTMICLAGSSIFSKASNALLGILLLSTFSIPLSALVMKPFENRRMGVEVTGPKLATLKENIKPRFTTGAAGSQLQGKENFQDLFGILFPATGGIFAGASMSGDLKHPSKAIPKGTLAGLGLTFFAYTAVIIAMAGTITRKSFYNDLNVIQDTNISGILVLAGELASTLFSSLMGVIGSAKLLQTLARDDLLPGVSIFGQGTKKNDEPTYAIFITYIVAQITMLADINRIASFITMTYLMTFLVTNLACFLLTIGSAPNFRPSFHYFNWHTAAAGTLLSGASMFFIDGLYASGSVCILIILFLIIHYTVPPKSWGDVSQSLIYHQVRKYLLRLKQEHVKFWRPQILLFINDPRRQYKLIQFCNSLKKGGLFVLGHVIVTPDFGPAIPEARRQQAAWTQYIDFSEIKAFVNITVSPHVEWGTRNTVLSAGLGGMRPNIVVMGFYNLEQFRREQPLIDVPAPQRSQQSARSAEDSTGHHKRTKSGRKRSPTSKMHGLLPTDTCRVEGAMKVTSYMTILEDLLLGLHINVAVAKGFQDLELPDRLGLDNVKQFIDLWPVQMSAEIAAFGGDNKHNVLTTNFDTYTLILQLGCILHTVPRWKQSYKLRVCVFVEYESEAEEERIRVKELLTDLRIEADVLVFWLASGQLKTYEVIVNGSTTQQDKDSEDIVDDCLKDEEWWQDLQRIRGKHGSISAREELAEVEGILNAAPWPKTSFQHSRREFKVERFERLKKFLRKSKRRSTISGLSNIGVSMGMRTHRLEDELVKGHSRYSSASESEDTLSDTDVAVEDETDPEPWCAGNSGTESDTDVSKVRPSSKLTRRRSHDGALTKSNTFPKLADRAVGSMLITTATTTSSSDVDVAVSSGPSNVEASISDSTNETPSRTRTRMRSSSRPDASSGKTKSHRSSAGTFTSKPVPKVRVDASEGPGPSIMFTDSQELLSDPTTPTEAPTTSIYSRQSRPAMGFPAQQAFPLSFNDLPCRAQHIILNELIQRQSDDTAVVFTTLPAPPEGTCQSEDDSLRYLSDLEVLCNALPPVLLVHSNSMTVTMNL